MLYDFTKKHIDELERAMLEEHRRDFEALARLKRFLPSNGAQAQPVAMATDPAGRGITKADSMSRPTIATPISDGPTDDVDPDHDPQDLGTLRDKIGEIMASDPNRTWTGKKMLEQLQSIKFPLQARKPISGIVTSMTYWVKQDCAVITRKGSGRAPNIVRWKPDRASPRSTQRQEEQRAAKSG